MKTQIVDLRIREGKLEKLVHTQIIPNYKFRLDWCLVEEVK